jgi:predicted lipoprotein with Yx(FWY)xxD motif
MDRTKNGGDRGRWAIRPSARRVLGIVGPVALLAVVGALAAGSIASGATTPTVSLRNTSLGSVLVNSKGHTLYLFMKDKNDKSSCSAACAKFWPPLIVHGKPVAGAGLTKAMLGTTKRSDGSMQVTYNKHPLYTFAEDKQAGQTKGEAFSAFGAKWYAVSAKGSAVTSKPASHGGGY